MSILIGLCGFTGVGKSTAISIMEERCFGQSIYLGQVVLDEVKRREMPLTRESERIVRVDLRRTDRGAFAKARANDVVSLLEQRRPVLIDAIVVIEEFRFFQSLVGADRCHLLEIRSSLDIRHGRLRDRPDRSFTHEEIAKRDRTELETLGSGKVFEAASYSVANDGTVDDFGHELAKFLDTVLPST